MSNGQKDPNHCIAITPNSGISPCDLEYFVQPIVHGLALLSEITSNERTGMQGVDEAISWLVEEMRDRTEELRAVVYGKRPRWCTGARGYDREEVLGRLGSDSKREDEPEMGAFPDVLATLNRPI